MSSPLLATPEAGAEGAKVKVTLTGAQETLLTTLYGRYLDSLVDKPILSDTWAAEAVNAVDYDFANLGVDVTAACVISLRARQLDAWTADFLARHEQRATVVHLACGLDARARRVPHGAGVRWIDVDLPDVVALRKQIMVDPPDGDYTLLGGSCLDPEFLASLPNDRPTIVVFEGLTPYLDAAEGNAFITSICERFEHGELAFDVVNWLLIMLQWTMSYIKKTSATMKWAVNDPRTLELLHHGLKLHEDLVVSTMEGLGEFPFKSRLIMQAHAFFPGFRYMSRCLRYTF